MPPDLDLEEAPGGAGAGVTGGASTPTAAALDIGPVPDAPPRVEERSAAWAEGTCRACKFVMRNGASRLGWLVAGSGPKRAASVYGGSGSAQLGAQDASQRSYHLDCPLCAICARKLYEENPNGGGGTSRGESATLVSWDGVRIERKPD